MISRFCAETDLQLKASYATLYGVATVSKFRSLLQSIVSFIGLFCERDP